MQWIMYMLSRDRVVQNRLRQEVMSVTNGEIADQGSLQKMPYLKGVIKEALRSVCEIANYSPEYYFQLTI